MKPGIHRRLSAVVLRPKRRASQLGIAQRRACHASGAQSITQGALQPSLLSQELRKRARQKVMHMQFLQISIQSTMQSRPQVHLGSIAAQLPEPAADSYLVQPLGDEVQAHFEV